MVDRVVKGKPVVEETPKEEVKEVKLTRKEKRYARIRKRLFKEKDILYEGPISYRVLRILAWICLALGQVVLLNSIGTNMFGYNQIGETGTLICSLFASLSTPFFIIASFGLVLSGRRDIHDFMLVYGLAYLGMGLGFVLFYLRYINGLFVKMGLDATPFPVLLEGFLADKVQVNVFADLFAFSLFHFFMNYTPKRIFKGKSLIVFRLFSLIPILFIIGSYVIKILYATDVIEIPFYIFPFLTTKSPIIYFVFVVVSLWIKNRERWFIKLGATKKEYQHFLNTKRNSLSISVHLSLLILVSVIFDILLFLFALIHLTLKNIPQEAIFDIIVNTYGVGQASGMVLAVPFILLYSYQRKHKDARVDIAIPIIGIALIVVVYVEGIYQFIINTFGL